MKWTLRTNERSPYLNIYLHVCFSCAKLILFKTSAYNVCFQRRLTLKQETIKFVKVERVAQLLSMECLLAGSSHSLEQVSLAQQLALTQELEEPETPKMTVHNGWLIKTLADIQKVFGMCNSVTKY